MRKTRIVIIFIALFTSIILYSSGEVMAHPGRTDSDGGHTCRTNCPSWGLSYGEYHYHNGGGGETTSYLSEAAQARVAGAEFARNERRVAIESSASVEGKNQGNIDGSNGISVPYGGNDSNQHCSQTVRFTNTPSDIYREAFQAAYTPTCTTIYNEAYIAAYNPANESAKQIYDMNNVKADAVEEEKSRWWGWIMLGGYIALLLLSAVGSSVKEWWDNLD